MKKPLTSQPPMNAIHHAVDVGPEMPAAAERDLPVAGGDEAMRNIVAARANAPGRSRSGFCKLVVPPSQVRLPEVMDASSIIFDQV